MGTENKNIQRKKNVDDTHDQKIIESNALVNLFSYFNLY